MRASGLIVALAGVVGSLRPPSAHAEPTSQPPDANAQAAVHRARAATHRQDYRAAIQHYSEALHLEPAAKLHFNLGACHHRLMLESPAQSAEYEHHRRAAIDAYHDYLLADPHASDTQTVHALIDALGGQSPSTTPPPPWTIVRIEPDPPRPPPQPSTSVPSTPTPPRPTVREQAPVLPRGSLEVFLPLSLVSPRQLATSAELRAAPTLGLGLRGGGYLGPSHGIMLGGELTTATQAVSAKDHHRLTMTTLGLMLEYQHRWRSKRGEVGVGGVMSMATQALVYEGSPPRRCAVDDRSASRRNGLWARVHAYGAVRLGTQRRHGIAIRIGPGLGVFGPGSTATTDAEGRSCSDELAAFAAYGLSDGASLVISFDVGYSWRF